MFVMKKADELSNLFKLIEDRVIFHALKFERADELHISFQPRSNPFKKFFRVANDIAENPLYIGKLFRLY